MNDAQGLSWPGGVERQFGVSLSGRGAVRAIPLGRRRMSLQVTFGIEPVQNKTGREGEDQNQYQRVDAHTHAPVPLQVRDIRTENAPRRSAGSRSETCRTGCRDCRRRTGTRPERTSPPSPGTCSSPGRPGPCRPTRRLPGLGDSDQSLAPATRLCAVELPIYWPSADNPGTSDDVAFPGASNPDRLEPARGPSRGAG